ncbi:MAG: hypothetical protein ABIO79_03730 [Ferruginibacter sp.]
MKKIFSLVLVVMAALGVSAQKGTGDTATMAKVTIVKDHRLDILAKAEVDVNNMAKRFTKGYRLFVLKSNNRDYAMKVRAYLLQNFPDEKVIMTYQSPFIKMKFGDFVDKADAEKCKELIMKSGVVTGGIYIVPDTIELKPDKMEQDEQQ